MFQTAWLCRATQAREGPHAVPFTTPAACSMGNVCCSRRAARTTSNEALDKHGLAGAPCPKAPRLDGDGNRITFSPRSGRMRLIMRTDSSELVKLD